MRFDSEKFNETIHTLENITSACVEIYQETGSDMLESMEPKQRAKYSMKHPYFLDLAGGRLHDAGIPANLIKKALAWCKKNP